MVIMMTDFCYSNLYNFTITRYGIGKEQDEGVPDLGDGMTAYCIALGTLWTYHYLLEDLVAHRLGRRNRVFGLFEIERRW